jgi:hypothetical protein
MLKEVSSTMLIYQSSDIKNKHNDPKGEGMYIVPDCIQ